ncbi:MAG: fumarylacetoacetase [Saprospiraceae bacterium]|nr:fumarylacetoacetase [Saprospiraceae bacterium]
MTSWKKIPEDSDFSIHNIPFGIFSTPRRTARIGVAIGEEIIDLAALNAIHLLEDFELDPGIFYQPTLNRFIGLGKSVTSKIRNYIQELLMDGSSPLKDHPALFVKQSNATMHLPVEIKDYTDFYSSMEHAINVGKMFRDPENALLPNWKHLPVAYHGRSSSIMISGAKFNRPKGQILGPHQLPVLAATKKLDFELELGFIIGQESNHGQTISTSEAEQYIFGFVLVNDWSARDIQKWEYVPLGPFLGKNFATSISPWIVTSEALETFKIKGPVQDPPVLEYLDISANANFNIDLEVVIRSMSGEIQTITKTNSRHLYWNVRQQLAHHTINGCKINIGDLMATGTISGQEEGSFGSMLELTHDGEKPIRLSGGTTRSFLEDYDSIIMKGSAIDKDKKVGFGEVEGQVLPAL